MREDKFKKLCEVLESLRALEKELDKKREEVYCEECADDGFGPTLNRLYDEKRELILQKRIKEDERDALLAEV